MESLTDSDWFAKLELHACWCCQYECAEGVENHALIAALLPPFASLALSCLESVVDSVGSLRSRGQTWRSQSFQARPSWVASDLQPSTGGEHTRCAAN